MTLGNAAAARVWLIVWCRDCQHQVEPDPAAMAERYGAEMTVPGLATSGLVCVQCGSRRVDFVVTGRAALTRNRQGYMQSIYPSHMQPMENTKS
jgi:hypothetical protein